MSLADEWLADLRNGVSIKPTEDDIKTIHNESIR